MIVYSTVVESLTVVKTTNTNNCYIMAGYSILYMYNSAVSAVRLFKACMFVYQSDIISAYWRWPGNMRQLILCCD